MKLIRYIHQNPVRAGMCSKVEDYKWNSDIYYRKVIRGFINISVILEMLDKNITLAVEKYKEFMEEEEATEYSKLNAIGEEAYRILCESRKEIEQRKRLDEILMETGVSGEYYQLVKAGSRKRILTEYKLKYAILALEHHYTLREIGQHISMTSAAINDMLNRYRCHGQ